MAAIIEPIDLERSPTMPKWYFDENTPYDPTLDDEPNPPWDAHEGDYNPDEAFPGDEDYIPHLDGED